MRRTAHVRFRAGRPLTQWPPQEQTLDVVAWFRGLRSSALLGILAGIVLFSTWLWLNPPPTHTYVMLSTIRIEGVQYLDAAAVIRQLVESSQSPSTWADTAQQLGAGYDLQQLRSRITVFPDADPMTLTVRVTGSDGGETERVAHVAVASFARFAPGQLAEPWPGQASITVTDGPTLAGIVGERDTTIMVATLSALATACVVAHYSAQLRSRKAVRRQEEIPR